MLIPEQVRKLIHQVLNVYNASATVLSIGSIYKTGYTFTGRNTAANGSGTAYSSGFTFNMPTY